jgi:hypothetical protein
MVLHQLPLLGGRPAFRKGCLDYTLRLLLSGISHGPPFGDALPRNAKLLVARHFVRSSDDVHGLGRYLLPAVRAAVSILEVDSARQPWKLMAGQAFTCPGCRRSVKSGRRHGVRPTRRGQAGADIPVVMSACTVYITQGDIWVRWDGDHV